jgi:hypothetical protein
MITILAASLFNCAMNVEMYTMIPLFQLFLGFPLRLVGNSTVEGIRSLFIWYYVADYNMITTKLTLQ